MHFLSLFLKSPERMLDYCTVSDPELCSVALLIGGKQGTAAVSTSTDEIWRKDRLEHLRDELLADIRMGWMYEERGKRWKLRDTLPKAFATAEITPETPP